MRRASRVDRLTLSLALVCVLGILEYCALGILRPWNLTVLEFCPLGISPSWSRGKEVFLGSCTIGILPPWNLEVFLS